MGDGMGWLKSHFWLVSALIGLVAYCFTTFATVRYVDQKHDSVEHRLDRIEYKIDRILLGGKNEGK